ncbi:MAG: DsbA family protein [Pseudomonadota bacterium]
MTRITALAFTLTFGLAAPGAALDLNTMSDEERALFRAEVRAYLMDNPEVLLEAIDVLETRQAEQQAADDLALVATHRDALFDDGYSFIGGNPDGDITIVEFLDYRCGFCKRAHPEVAELVRTDGNIRYVIKELPILGEESVLASRFAIAVKEVEGDAAYYDIHNALMEMRGAVTEQALSDMSEAMGFNTPDVFSMMNTDAVREVIEKNRELAGMLGIQGTPSFIFESQMRRGYLPLDAMRDVIAEERS